jgi:hypothetical protein
LNQTLPWILRKSHSPEQRKEGNSELNHQVVCAVVKDKVLASVGIIRMCSVSVLSDLAQQFGEFAKRRLSRTNILPGI